MNSERDLHGEPGRPVDDVSVGPGNANIDEAAASRLGPCRLVRHSLSQRLDDSIPTCKDNDYMGSVFIATPDKRWKPALALFDKAGKIITGASFKVDVCH